MFKRLGVHCLLLCLAVCLCGCQPGSEQGDQAEVEPVDVVVEGGGEFPENLAGKWIADEQGWEIVFERDGSISSAVISLGRIELQPGQVTKVPMMMDGEGVFEAGKWLVHYVPETRELTVWIVLNDFRVVMGESILEGSSTDLFVGRVSEDGNAWPVEWTSYPNYIGHTPELENFDFSGEDRETGVTRSLLFEKVQDEQQ